jgi:hypothetical protein
MMARYVDVTFVVSFQEELTLCNFVYRSRLLFPSNYGNLGTWRQKSKFQNPFPRFSYIHMRKTRSTVSVTFSQSEIERQPRCDVKNLRLLTLN